MINKNLSSEINQMAKLDQIARKATLRDDSAWKKVRVIDKENLIKIKKIVKKHGWPIIELVGKKASNNAWLIVQHADADVDFQEYCLQLIKKAIKVNEIAKSNIAYLTDRILVNKGKPQIYGTQFRKNPSGELVPQKIKSEKNLNALRKKMRLETFEVYKKRIEATQ